MLATAPGADMAVGSRAFQPLPSRHSDVHVRPRTGSTAMSGAAELCKGDAALQGSGWVVLLGGAGVALICGFCVQFALSREPAGQL
jgi:hypothetical protein